MRRLAAVLLLLCSSLLGAGGSFQFDGVNDAVSIDSLTITAEVITVSAWIYSPRFRSDNQLYWESSISYSTRSGTVVFAPHDSSGPCAGRITAAVAEGGSRRSECVHRRAGDSWHHWAIVYDNSTATGDVKFYVNGVEDTDTTLDANTKTSSGDFGAWDWYLLNRAGNQLEADARLRDFRIYERELSAAEVTSVMAGQALGDEFAWIPATDAATPLLDISGNGRDATCSNCPAVSWDGPPRPSSELLLFDGFDSGISGWTVEYNCTTSGPPSYVHTSTVASRSGALRQSTNCFKSTPRDGHAAYWDAAAAASWTDYEITAWVYNSDDDGVGIAFRYTDIENHYRVDCDDQRNFCALVRVDENVQTTIGTDSTSAQCNGTYFDDGWHEWQIRVEGDDFDVSIDGTDCFGTVTDTALTSGTVAAWGWGSQSTYYDSIRVREIK